MLRKTIKLLTVVMVLALSTGLLAGCYVSTSPGYRHHRNRNREKICRINRKGVKRCHWRYY